jgi:hypothetical protein
MFSTTNNFNFVTHILILIPVAAVSDAIAGSISGASRVD